VRPLLMPRLLIKCLAEVGDVRDKQGHSAAEERVYQAPSGFGYGWSREQARADRSQVSEEAGKENYYYRIWQRKSWTRRLEPRRQARSLMSRMVDRSEWAMAADQDHFSLSARLRTMRTLLQCSGALFTAAHSTHIFSLSSFSVIQQTKSHLRI
jgi:hypothetical protein